VKILAGECSLYSNHLVQSSFYLLREQRSHTSFFSNTSLDITSFGSKFKESPWRSRTFGNLSVKNRCICLVSVWWVFTVTKIAETSKA